MEVESVTVNSSHLEAQTVGVWRGSITAWTAGEAGDAHSAAPGPPDERMLERRGSPREPFRDRETDDEGDDGGRVRLGDVVPDDDAGADDYADDGDALNGPVAADRARMPAPARTSRSSTPPPP